MDSEREGVLRESWNATYTDGWREEDFRGMPNSFAAPMPWYFRTVGSWIAVLRASGFRVDECREPRHPETNEPLSMLWIATPAPAEDVAS